MCRAANHLAALGVFLLQLPTCAWAMAQEGASSGSRSPTVSVSTVAVEFPPVSVRAAPSRPAGASEYGAGTDRPTTGGKALPTLPVTRIKGTDYVAANDVATQLSFRKSWEESKRELTLSAGPRRLVLTAEKREVSCNGLRIFLGLAVQLRGGQLYVTKTDYERCLLGLLRPDLVSEPVPRLRTIVLDPGHGGTDPGMENKSLRIQEKVLALDVALRLEKLLKAEGYSVVLTRRDDRQLAPTKEADLQRRAIIANAAGADLFLSIHFNSLYPDTRVGGSEVYVFTRPGQRSDTSWGFGQPDDTERDAAPVNRLDAWTSLLAHSLHRETLAGLKTADRGHKTKHVAVLRGLNCAGVLVESLFLSNEAEARRASVPAYRQQIADAMFAGVRSYAATLDSVRPKFSVPAATASRPVSPNSP